MPMEVATGEILNDVLGELINIVGGHVKATLPGRNTLGLPVVATGSWSEAMTGGGRTATRACFRYQELPFWVIVAAR
jgi:hypothetical protein